jgi:hypothetical protein
VIFDETVFPHRPSPTIIPPVRNNLPDPQKPPISFILDSDDEGQDDSGDVPPPDPSAPANPPLPPADGDPSSGASSSHTPPRQVQHSAPTPQTPAPPRGWTYTCGSRGQQLPEQPVFSRVNPNHHQEKHPRSQRQSKRSGEDHD